MALFNSRWSLTLPIIRQVPRISFSNLPAPTGSSYARYYVNAGEIQNKGVEIVLNATPVMTKDFRWKTGVNFATNKNEAIKLVDELDRFMFNGGESNNVWSYLEVGGSFGDIYGTTFVRDDNGKIQYEKKVSGN